MDPLSQGVIAAVAAQQFAKKKFIVIATIIGFISGLAPDVDIFIRSSDDPFLSLEYHRQFTHSLLFIPIGSFICSSFFYFIFLRKKDISFKDTYLYSTLGYATHGLLDACTTYGTQLLWPFSNERIAWNLISIIDPLFTLPLVILVLLMLMKKNKFYAHISLLWVFIYISLGIVQKERAEDTARAIAKSRNHDVIDVTVKPSFANLVVWKTIYSTKSTYYVDAVSLKYNTEIFKGKKINKLNVSNSFPWLSIKSQQARDIQKFSWFSNGYIALSPYYENRIIDIRYSMLPNDIKALWGIELDSFANDNKHAQRVFNRRSNIENYIILWGMIIK